MKKTLFILSLLAIGQGQLFAKTPTTTTDHKPTNYLWFSKPGINWESEGLPIGNGRIGAMVFGGDKQERLALNEISFWTGGENPGGGYGYGPESGKNEFGAYQPFADLLIDFKGEAQATDYVRSLDIDDAIARVSYKKDGVTFNREVFASFPHQVMLMSCTADKPGALSATFSYKTFHGATITSKDNTLTMSGTLKNGLQYEGRVIIAHKGGTLTANGESLKLEGATSCTVTIAMATDYEMNYKKGWKGESPTARINKQLANIKKTSFKEMKAAHIANYHSLFNRVKFEVGSSPKTLTNLPTDERLKTYKIDKTDPDLEETLFNMGRYLLISSSRPGTLPANLQGLWNDKTSPPWACDYHSNINLQMAYWLAEPSNLSECHLPLINYFSAVAEPSRIASQKEFKTQSGSKVRGWTTRTSQNAFGGNGWEWNIPSSAWYALHMWEHYAFTQDKNYLENQAYPMMKEISQFWEDHLKELGENGAGFKSAEANIDLAELKGIKKGTLVAPNGWSPEHGPREDGVAHDQQLIWSLFTNTIEAARILGLDREWAKNLKEKRDLLAGPKIGKEGNLQEWMIDRIPKTQHRHTSHLFAVYPGNQLSLEKTPELAEAARKSLEWRGSTGDSRRSWTWPWRTALWARFQDGDRAHDMVSGLLEHNTLNNLITTHAPLQLDGSFGITGGICEMLVQSHAGEISLLPAPTKAWPKGFVKGLKTRGNVTVDLAWEDGKVTDYTLYSPNTKITIPVRVNGQVKKINPQPLPQKKTQK